MAKVIVTIELDSNKESIILTKLGEVLSPELVSNEEIFRQQQLAKAEEERKLEAKKEEAKIKALEKAAAEARAKAEAEAQAKIKAMEEARPKAEKEAKEKAAAEAKAKAEIARRAAEMAAKAAEEAAKVAEESIREETLEEESLDDENPEPELQTPNDNPGGSHEHQDVYTIEEVRALLAQKVADHRQEIKNKLTTLGAPNVTNLDPAKYTEFADYLKSLS